MITISIFLKLYKNQPRHILISSEIFVVEGKGTIFCPFDLNLAMGKIIRNRRQRRNQIKKLVITFEHSIYPSYKTTNLKLLL